MPRHDTIYDVAIVGYGPVGATLANLLAQYGLKVAVVEQADGIYDKPRAITLDHEILRTFQACGIADAVEPQIAPHPGTHYLGVDREIIKIFDPLPPPYPLGWVPTATFVQPEIERILREKLAQYDRADIFLSTRAAAFSQDDETVALTVQSAGGEESVLHARYLVACDGANSFVRKQLGIRLADLEFDEWWMVVDAWAGDLKKRPDKCFQYCWPSRPGTYLPGPGALRRWEIKLLPGECPKECGTPDNVIRLLAEFTDISDLKIWRSAVYRFHALLADRWRAGRIFMMGDAVHQTPPFLGQGLCAGIRDAFNLAWKLAFVLKGKSDDTLLDTYERERKPHVAAVVATAKQFGKIIGELDPVAARERDERLRAELKSGQAVTIRQKFIPDLASGLIATGAPAAGALFVQPRVRLIDGRVVRLDDVMNPGFAVVSDDPQVLSWLAPDALKILNDLGGQRVIVGRGMAVKVSAELPEIAAEDGLLSDWMRSLGVRAIVVRPDRYVFGAANDAEQLNALMRLLGDKLCQTSHLSGTCGG